MNRPAVKERKCYMENIRQQATIYVGLNDRITGVQKYDTEKYLSILKNACRSYRVAFSVQMLNGGYFHEDGRYVEESTLVLRLVDVPSDTITEIAKDLCVFFNQESVMVTLNETSVIFIKENL